MAEAATITIRIDGDTARLVKELKKANTQTKKWAGGTRKQVGGVQKAFVKLSAVIGVFAIGSFVRGVVDAGLAMERFERALKVATGSAEGAKREMAFIIATSKELGVNLESSAAAYSKLAAAAQGTALEGQATRDIFTAISEASVVLGLTSEQTGGALTALEQIISKGKVSAEELRGQLGERLPGAFQIAARSIGKTTAELDKMLRLGELTADDLLPKLAEELHKTFGPEVAAAADSAQASFARFNTAVFELKNEIATGGILEALASLARLTTFVISSGSPFGEESDKLGKEVVRLRTIQASLRKQLEGAQNPGSREDGFLGVLVRRIKGTEDLNAHLDDLKKRLDETTAKLRIVTQQQIRVVTGTTAPERDTQGVTRVIVDVERASADLDSFFAKQDADLEKLKGSFVRTFETAEQEVARILEQFDLVAHLFPPEERARIKKAIRETLTDGIEEIDIDFEKMRRDFDKEIIGMRDSSKKTFEEMDELAKQAARNIQDAFADFLFDPFDKGIKGMLRSFVDAIRKMIANKLATQLFGFLGGFFKGFGKSGGTKIPGFAKGGDITAGQVSVVGEQGPELFIPKVAGKIIPNDEISSSKKIDIKGFATGGNLQAGVPAIVGEKGPELFIPKKAGTVVPNNKAGRSLVINFGDNIINAPQVLDPATLIPILDANNQKVKGEFLDELDRGGFA